MFRRRKDTTSSHAAAAAPLQGLPGRFLSLKIILLLFFVVIALRLVQIQLIESGKYQEIARRQYEAKVILPAARGNLYDRNGKLLVSNTMMISFGADPKMVGNRADAIATRFARVFESSRASYLERLNRSDRHFVWLERRVPPSYSRQIRVWEFEGTLELEEPQRLYHYDHVGGQLIGFTDVDNNGLSGIELQLNDELRGTNGFVIMQRDGLGRKRPSVVYPRVEEQDAAKDIKAVTKEFENVQRALAPFKAGLLHGRVKSAVNRGSDLMGSSSGPRSHEATSERSAIARSKYSKAGSRSPSAA